MKIICKNISSVFLIMTVLLTIVACGKGGSGSHSAISGSGGSGNDDESSSAAQADSITLRWSSPNRNMDGSSLNDLGGYILYYGKSVDYTYTRSKDVGNRTSATVRNLSQGRWCFSVTAYDHSGNESDYSDEVCTDV